MVCQRILHVKQNFWNYFRHEFKMALGFPTLKKKNLLLISEQYDDSNYSIRIKTTSKIQKIASVN
jgi:hypothetical protein